MVRIRVHVHCAHECDRKKKTHLGVGVKRVEPAGAQGGIIRQANLITALRRERENVCERLSSPSLTAESSRLLSPHTASPHGQTEVSSHS